MLYEAAVHCRPEFKPNFPDEQWRCPHASVWHQPCYVKKCHGYRWGRVTPERWGDAGRFIGNFDDREVSTFLQALYEGGLTPASFELFRRQHSWADAYQDNGKRLRDKLQREYVVPQATLDRQAAKREQKRTRRAQRKQRAKARRMTDRAMW